MEVKREKVPIVDEQGKVILDDQGQARTKNVVIKQETNVATFIGAENFKRLISDPQVKEAVLVTLLFVSFAVPLELIFGFLLAILFNQHIFGRPLLRSIMILPIFATPLAVGYTFFTIFYEVGGPLAWTGIPFLSNPSGALFSVILVDIWQWTPFCFLVFLAALQSVPDELYEAAHVDGASRLAMLTQVMLPLLKPTILIVLLLRLAEALKFFDIPFSMTGGGPGVATQPFSLLAFRTGLRFFDLGYASAMAYALLAATMVVIMLFFRRLRESYD
ncbi:MAG: sugar ABC transporter permease [Alphaproteobacteria bacterium]|nr:sugar ABC transporter permease [Alphaproteobacteria bacterium]